MLPFAIYNTIILKNIDISDIIILHLILKVISMCKQTVARFFKVSVAQKSYRVFLTDVKFIRKLRRRKTPAIPAYGDEFCSKE